MLSVLSDNIPQLSPFCDSWALNFICGDMEKCYFNECDECLDGKRLLDLQVPDDAHEKIVEVLLWKKEHNIRLKADQVVRKKIVLSLDSLFNVRTVNIKYIIHVNLFSALLF
jgi:hypothetical protein